jgi:Fe-S-cluster containining protein
MSRLEWKRICVRLGYDTNTPQPAETVLANLIDTNHMNCPMLKDGRCSVYDIRPAICRLFGAAADKMLECPKGCRPETYMDGAKAGSMLSEVERLGA